MELITTKTVLASDMGANDNMFGGVMLAELDLAGASYASQICDSPRLVTKKFEETQTLSKFVVTNEFVTELTEFAVTNDLTKFVDLRVQFVFTPKSVVTPKSAATKK